MDALDVQMYDDHHQRGQCYLSLSKVTSSTYDDFLVLSYLFFLVLLLREFSFWLRKFNSLHEPRDYLKTVGMPAFLTIVYLID